VPTQLLGALLTAIAMLPSAGADDVALTEHGTAFWRKLVRKFQLPLRVAVVWPITWFVAAFVIKMVARAELEPRTVSFPSDHVALVIAIAA
jgi:hypothetical protein